MESKWVLCHLCGSKTVVKNTDCPYKKKKCERHVNCAACREYHATSKRKRLPTCEREKHLFHKKLKQAN